MLLISLCKLDLLLSISKKLPKDVEGVSVKLENKTLFNNLLEIQALKKTQLYCVQISDLIWNLKTLIMMFSAVLRIYEYSLWKICIQDTELVLTSQHNEQANRYLRDAIFGQFPGKGQVLTTSVRF